MAEIKITKKSPVWPWILLLLLVIGGVLYYLYYKGDLSEKTVNTTTEQIDDDSYNSTSRNEMQENSEWDDTNVDTTSVRSEEDVY